MYESLYLSSNIFKNSTSTNKIVILLTDGLNTIDSISLDIALEKVKKYGLKVYTIGVGKEGDYNKNILTKIAKQTGGEFYETSNPKKLEEIYNKIDDLEKSKIKTTKYTQNIYYFQYPLYVVLVLMLLYILMVRKKL